MQLQRDEVSMTLMKKQMQAEQAMAQMLMEAAKNIEQITSSSTGSQGSIVDIYV
jgi:hypothetical protein